MRPCPLEWEVAGLSQTNKTESRASRQTSSLFVFVQCRWKNKLIGNLNHRHSNQGRRAEGFFGSDPKTTKFLKWGGSASGDAVLVCRNGALRIQPLGSQQGLPERPHWPIIIIGRIFKSISNIYRISCGTYNVTQDQGTSWCLGQEEGSLVASIPANAPERKALFKKLFIAEATKPTQSSSWPYIMWGFSQGVGNIRFRSTFSWQ